MIKTHGLTHIALAVKNAKRSFEFYRQVFGVIKVYDENGWGQAQTPGAHDILVFDEIAPRPGKAAVSRILAFVLSTLRKLMLLPKQSGRRTERFWTRASFVRANPYLFFKDLDGYGVEIALNCRRQRILSPR